jgi:hypothetical protein
MGLGPIGENLMDNRHAFALMELPLALLVLFLSGLLVAFVYSFFTCPAPGMRGLWLDLSFPWVHCCSERYVSHSNPDRQAAVRRSTRHISRR